MRPAGHNGHKRTGEQHPEALHRWLSEEAAHAFFQRRSLHMVTIANSPTCEPFLLPPDTEIWPPRLHRSFWQSAFSRSARKPQPHMEQRSPSVERASAGARALCPRGTSALETLRLKKNADSKNTLTPARPAQVLNSGCGVLGCWPQPLNEERNQGGELPE